jgi:hypothetical protein
MLAGPLSVKKSQVRTAKLTCKLYNSENTGELLNITITCAQVTEVTLGTGYLVCDAGMVFHCPCSFEIPG